MSYTLNQVTIVGRVGNIKEATYGNNFCLRFSVATDRAVYMKDGEEQTPIVDWHYITVWRDRAIMCKDRLKVGDLVSITGEIRYNKDKKDSTRIYTEIHIPDNAKIGFLGSSKKQQEPQYEPQQSMPLINGVKPYASNANKVNNPFKKSDPIKETLKLDDDIPF